MQINVLIVDDEPRAHKVLETFIHRIPYLTLTGNCYNAKEAYEFVKSHKVHLILLDITMPEINGFGFLDMIKNSIQVIFTTAHSEYALDSYDYDAIDYLKKPISFERFEKSINKASLLISKGLSFAPQKNTLMVRINGEDLQIPLNTILYFKSLGNYVKIITEQKSYLTQITTKELEVSLPKDHFFRIHKSFIVNKNKIESISDTEICIQKMKLPIGKTFKRYVKDFLRE